MTSIMFSQDSFIYYEDGDFTIRKHGEDYVIVYDVRGLKFDTDFEILETGTFEECRDLFYDCVADYCSRETVPAVNWYGVI